MPELEAYAYTDGASVGSRGPGGYGAVLTWKGKTVEISGGERDTTNQRMEIKAALEAVTTLEGPLTVVSDSTYVVNCFRDSWWRGWLDLKRAEIAHAQDAAPRAPAVGLRIELTDVKERLRRLTPGTYTGVASALVDRLP